MFSLFPLPSKSIKFVAQKRSYKKLKFSRFLIRHFSLLENLVLFIVGLVLIYDLKLQQQATPSRLYRQWEGVLTTQRILVAWHSDTMRIIKALTKKVASLGWAQFEKKNQWQNLRTITTVCILKININHFDTFFEIRPTLGLNLRGGVH